MKTYNIFPIFVISICLIASCNFIEKQDLNEHTYIIKNINSKEKVDLKGFWRDTALKPVKQKHINEILNYFERNLDRFFDKIKTPNRSINSSQLHKIQTLFLPEEKIFTKSEITTLLIFKKILIGGDINSIAYDEANSLLKALKKLPASLVKCFWLRMSEEQFEKVPIFEIPTAINNVVEVYKNLDSRKGHEIISKKELSTLLHNLKSGDFSLTDSSKDFIASLNNNIDTIFELFGLIYGNKNLNSLSDEFFNIYSASITSISNILKMNYQENLRASLCKQAYRETYGNSIEYRFDPYKDLQAFTEKYYKKNNIVLNYFSHTKEESAIISKNKTELCKTVYDNIISLNRYQQITQKEFTRILEILKELNIIPKYFNIEALVKFIYRLKTDLYHTSSKFLEIGDFDLLWNSYYDTLKSFDNLANLWGINKKLTFKNILSYYLNSTSSTPYISNWLNQNQNFLQASVYPYPPHNNSPSDEIPFYTLKNELISYHITKEFLKIYDYNEDRKISLEPLNKENANHEISSFTFTIANLLLDKFETFTNNKSSNKDKPTPVTTLESFTTFQRKISYFMTFIGDNFLSNSVSDMKLSHSELNEFVSRIAKIFITSNYCYVTGKYLKQDNRNIYTYIYNKPDNALLTKHDILYLIHNIAALALINPYDSGLGSNSTWYNEKFIYNNIPYENYLKNDLIFLKFLKKVTSFLLKKHNRNTDRPLDRGDCVLLGSSIVLSDILFKKLSPETGSIKYSILANYILQALKNSYPDKNIWLLKASVYLFLTNKTNEIKNFNNLNLNEKIILAKQFLFETKPEAITIDSLAYSIYQLLETL